MNYGWFRLSVVLRRTREYFAHIGDVLNAVLQSLGLYSASTAYEQGRDLYCVTPAVTRDLVFFSLVQMTASI